MTVQKRTTIPVVLLGVDKNPRGDLGLSLLAELISEATRKSLADKGYELRVTGLSDFEGTTDFKGIAKTGIYDSKLKKALSTKKNGGSFLERPWTVYLSPSERFGQFVAESHLPGLVVIDMSHPYDLEKSSALLAIVKDLKVSLLCPLSRPPAFKDKCASLLGPCFKSFVKLPSVKRLVYAIVEAFESNPDRESPSDPKLIARILGLEEIEEQVDTEEPDMPLLDMPFAKTERLSVEKRKKIIQDLTQDPQMGMARIKQGSMDYVAGLSHLAGLGAHLPSSIIIGPMTQFHPDLGFGPYFTCMEAMAPLIQGALTAFSNEETSDLGCYLECLYNLLLPTPRFCDIADMFEQNGGPELLFKRHRFNSVLYHSDKTVREYARQCLSLLVERGHLKRKCETCGRQERSIAEFDCCSECRLAAYCSGACQMKDWQRKHSTDCRPPRLEPDVLPV